MEVFADERPVEPQPINIHVDPREAAGAISLSHIKFVEDYIRRCRRCWRTATNSFRRFYLVKNAQAHRRAGGGGFARPRRFGGVGRLRRRTKARISLPLESASGTRSFPRSRCCICSIRSSPPSRADRSRPCARGQDRRRSRRHHRMQLQPRRTIFRVLMPKYHVTYTATPPPYPPPQAGEGRVGGAEPDGALAVTRGSMPRSSSPTTDAAIRTAYQALSRAGYEVRSTRPRLALDQPRRRRSDHHRRTALCECSSSIAHQEGAAAFARSSS